MSTIPSPAARATLSVPPSPAGSLRRLAEGPGYADLLSLRGTRSGTGATGASTPTGPASTCRRLPQKGGGDADGGPEHRDSMLPSDTISGMEVNASFDSELEALFTEGLRRRVKALPGGEMAKHVINGKSGYYLRLGRGVVPGAPGAFRQAGRRGGPSVADLSSGPPGPGGS